MINYITLGTNNLERAASFYDELLALLGARELFSWERIKFWGTSPTLPLLGVCIPYDGEPQHRGNGVMVGIAAESRLAVDELYAKALLLGASNEGPPGERMPNFYAAYVRDLDGNKLCFFKSQPPAE